MIHIKFQVKKVIFLGFKQQLEPCVKVELKSYDYFKMTARFRREEGMERQSTSILFLQLALGLPE